MQKDSVEIRSIDGKLVLIGKCKGQIFRIFLDPESAAKLAADLVSALPKQSTAATDPSNDPKVMIIREPRFTIARNQEQVDLYIRGSEPPFVKMTIPTRDLITFSSELSNELEALSFSLRSDED